MAKTVRQQLADLAGGKKPNVFYKGLNTDTDEHLIGSDQFTDAKNVRINSKDTDFGTLQNLKSNLLESTISTPGWVFTPTAVANQHFWGATAPGDSSVNLSKLSFAFELTGGSFVQFTSNPSDNFRIDVGITYSDFIYGRPYYASSIAYTNDDIILHVYDSLKNNAIFNAVMTVTLGQTGTVKGSSLSLYFFPKNTALVPDTSNSITLYRTLDGATTNTTGGTNLFSSTSYGADGFGLNILALESFSDYMAAICFNSSTLQAVVKIFTNDEGRISSFEPIVISNFGLANYYTAITTQKVEENENYNRIYWTDGVNPIKTVNLEATGGFYNDFSDPDDFNLFAKSSLTPLEVVSVKDGGSINCGSWSYCYRLKTDDGKTTVFSPITNPIPLPKSNKNIESHLVEGGLLSDNSGKSVTLTITGIEEIYTSVELIGIHYLDEVGGAAFYLIKEEGVSSSICNLTHNGNESTTPITAASILTKKNTWDVCQDIEVKDNRLFAANLKNLTDEIVSDYETFKVKSYKHSDTNATWSPSSGTYTTYTSDFVNPDLYEAELYKYPNTDTSQYRYALGPSGTSPLVFGASTPTYHTANTGVYVSFKLKKFTLNQFDYWHNFKADVDGSDDFNTDGVCIPPFVGIHPYGEDQNFDNYKNPVFANKYVGYMRDEIYRFGIQFYDKDGNQSFTYPIGDVRFPSIENDLRIIGTTIDTYSFATAPTNKYILKDELGNGYILYPEFRIKLSADIRKKISGFNIVRAERNDIDKRVVAAGMLNQTLIYSNDSENKSLKNKIGLDKIPLFTQNTSYNTGDFDFGTADQSSVYTLDTPEVLFNSLNYIKSGEEKLKICNKFLCKSYTTDDKPMAGDAINITSSSASDVDWMTHQGTASTFFAAPMEVNHTTAPDLADKKQNSFFSLYYSDDSETSPLHTTAIADAGHYSKTLHFGKNVGADELVPSSLLSATKDFKNRAEVYTDSNVLNHINLDGGFIESADSRLMIGGRTLVLNLTSDSFFTFSNQYIFHTANTVTPVIKNSNYYAAKPYAKIIKTMTNDSGQYGGNTNNAFVSQRWISTGASLHGNDITDGEMILSVFGGDTYINMLSLSKFHQETYNTDSKFRYTQGLIFPVESSINVDLRRGNYFGKNSAELQVEDEYLISSSYSATNNLKSFPSKDPKIEIVNDYKNLIAASNVKISGQTQDAFARFDANEIFQVNPNYGPIYNITSFKDTLYAIQEKAISVLSINTRALIQSKDGSSISIQSELGTGNVIERNDYISTKYGSQNRLNTISTDMGLYWLDNNNAAICVVPIANKNQVVNLTELSSCSSLLSEIKTTTIKDNPLNIALTTNTGGIDVSYNPYYNEILFSISYYKSGYKHLCVAYDEANKVFLGNRSYSTLVNCTHRGVLYSVGYEHSQTIQEAADARRKKIYSHDTTATNYNVFYSTTTDNPNVTLVNNEEIVSLKVYDKIVLSTQEHLASGIFSKFVFNTNVDAGETLDLASTNIDKVIVGKQIVPVFVTKRQKGNYLKIKVEQSVNPTTQIFNLFSVVSHYRKNIL